MRVRRSLLWALSIGAAAWTVSAARELVADSPPTMQWSAELGCVTLHEGQTWRRRNEGSGTSRVGRLGILGVPDAPGDPRPKVAIWGDSFIEGSEVSDHERLPQILTRDWNASHASAILAVGIGAAGRSVADQLPLIPKYQGAVPGIRVHAIFLPGLGDILPDSPEAQLARFTAVPRLRVVPAPEVALSPESERRQIALRALGLRWLASQAKRAAQGDLGLRFRPGPVAGPARVSADVPSEPTPELDRAVSWILDRLRETTTRPIVLVLMPRDTPEPSPHGVVLRDEPTDLERLVARRCEERGMGFVNLRRPFDDAWRRGEGLPRGFGNSRPGDGHMNATGHAAAARALASWLEEHHALLAP